MHAFCTEEYNGECRRLYKLKYLTFIRKVDILSKLRKYLLSTTPLYFNPHYNMHFSIFFHIFCCFSIFGCWNFHIMVGLGQAHSSIN